MALLTSEFVLELVYFFFQPVQSFKYPLLEPLTFILIVSKQEIMFIVDIKDIPLTIIFIGRSFKILIVCVD